MSVKVKKFSWNPKDKEAKVEYLVETEGGQEKHILECADQPMPECLDAMQDLESLALHECEVIRVGDRKFREGISKLCGEASANEFDSTLKMIGANEAFATVRTVSWSWSAADVMGACICLLIKLENSNSPLVVNTPHKPEAQYSEGGTTPTLPEELVRKLRWLHELVVRYIDGERFREQIDMFEEQAS